MGSPLVATRMEGWQTLTAIPAAPLGAEIRLPAFEAAGTGVSNRSAHGLLILDARSILSDYPSA